MYNNDPQSVFEELFKTQFKSKTYKALLRQQSVHHLRMAYALLMMEDEDEADKTQVINLIYNYYEMMFEYFFENIHSELLDYIFEIVDNDGELLYKDETPFRAMSMAFYLIAFPVSKNGQFKLVMSNEVLAYLKTLNREELYSCIEENNIVVTYARSLVNYYGLLPIELLIQYLKDQQGIVTNENIIHLLLNIDGLFAGYYDVSEGDLIHAALQENHQLLFLVENSEHKFYPFSKEQILNPKEEEQYIEANKKLMKYIQLNYGISKEEVDYLNYLIDNLISFEQSADAIIAMMEMMFDTKSNNNYEILQKLVNNVIKNKRKWTLRGHTEQELSNKLNHPKLIKFNKKEE